MLPPRFWCRFHKLPTNAKLPGVTLLMTQVPLNCLPGHVADLTAGRSTSPRCWLGEIVTLPEESVLMTRVILLLAVELLLGGR